MFDAYISNIILQIGDVYNSIQLIEADKDKQSFLYSDLKSKYESLHSELWVFIRLNNLDFPKKHLELLRKYCTFSPLTAFKCANYIKERCIDLEKIIATDARSSYQYAESVLRGKFELGEPSIATDSLLSYMYSVFVIRNRFELGEKAINSNLFFSQLYERFLSN